MRTPTAPALLLAFTLASCAGDNSTTIASSARTATLARAGGQASAPKPFAGRCDLTVAPLPSAPPLIRQTDTGTCQLSHLGRTKYEGVLELDLVARTQRGERTLTAANGDELHLTTVGTSAPAGPGLVSFTATFTIVGGTGRFAKATGQGRAEGTANLTTSKTSVEMDGWIDYDASDRSGS
jgi:hypothetical protein